MGAYTGEFTAEQPSDTQSFFSKLYQKAQRLKRQLSHLMFFSQIVPKLPATANRELIVIPNKNHNEGISDAHLHMQVAKSLLANRIPKKDAEAEKKDKEYKLEAVANRTKIAQNSYVNYKYDLCTEESYRRISPRNPNKLYCAIKDGVLQYTVISPSGEVVTDKIDLKELGCDTDGFYAVNPFFSHYHQEKNLILQLKAKLPDILKITAERGHTIKERTQNQNSNVPIFPPSNHLQRIFGVNTKQLYQHTDKLHPTPHLRSGFEWSSKETLVDWWNKHEKKASLISTDLTKDLIKTIQKTTDGDIESLKTLFKATDRWLMLKEGRPSSRYYQVESLRNNIFDRLTTQMGVDKADLIAINHTLMKEEHYFLNHWKHASAAASYFKTKETKALDQAFISHEKGEMPMEDLLKALDNWLEIKQTSNSKRYDLVIQMREQLQEFIRLEPNSDNALSFRL